MKPKDFLKLCGIKTLSYCGFLKADNIHKLRLSVHFLKSVLLCLTGFKYLSESALRFY